MKKTLLLLMLSFLGCNYGNSIADQKPGSGGSTGTASGGSSGAPRGGTTGASTTGSGGTSSGGTTAASSGGSSGSMTSAGTGGSTTMTASGGSSGASSGGATGSGSGGATTVTGSGGRVTGSGGSMNADAGAADGSSGDAASTGTSKADAATMGTGGATGTGGAKGTGGAAGTGGASGTGGSTTACVPAASGGPTGMNTGQDCTSCHGSGQSPAMKIAGTIYSSATGGSGVSGATVTVTDSTGAKVTMVTGSSGNFYSNTSISFPATVVVSKCPDTQTMPVSLTKGGCNSSGCHDSSNRIHLP